MRIGIDMLGLQSPDSRLRGVGRFGRDLLAALVRLDPASEFVLYAHDGLPTDTFPRGLHTRVVPLAPDPSRGEPTIGAALARVVREDPDGIDVFLTINPFELTPGFAPPPRPLAGPKLVAVVHDLIPFLFPERYLADPGHGRKMYRHLDRVRTYDALLTNSDATRSDCLRLLGMPADRVVTIGGAGDAAFFRPDRSAPLAPGARRTLNRLGIDRPFVYCVAGRDERKNLRGLIEAFGLLPAGLRLGHRLVVTGHLEAEDEAKARGHALANGVNDALVLTGEVADEELRTLYQRCAAFAFPSLYEGLGFPLLEAMLCGAAVVAGNNSSQPEVVGDAGLLANAADAGDVATALARVLADGRLADELGKRAIARAATFTWDRAAGRAIEAIERVVREARRHPLARRKPRLAVFSPWPPKGSGISTYATRLIVPLRDQYAIDLYHEPGYVPEPALASRGLGSFDYRAFPRRSREVGYRGVLYQMGNSFYHGFVYDFFQQFPGVVTLHDFCLSGFQFWRAHRGGDPFENLRREVAYCEPERFAELDPQIRGWTEEPGGFQEATTRRGLALNRRVFEHAKAVVVHAEWCREQARAIDPRFGAKTAVIPHGATPCVVPPARRAEIRARHGLPADALVVGSFGILTQGKMNVEALEAFAPLARERPGAVMIFAGADWENGQAKAAADRLGLGAQARFLGRQSDEAFADLIAATDIGVCLRRPPTYGETSGALLDLLRHGVACVISDVATFSSYPDAIVRKVRWPEDGVEGIARALRGLADDPAAREALGRSALRYVADYHTWPVVAGQYAELIERIFAGRRRRSAPAA